jgi:formate-dependent nitrite reductase membrane component NrfD
MTKEIDIDIESQELFEDYDRRPHLLIVIVGIVMLVYTGFILGVTLAPMFPPNEDAQ